MKRFVLFILAAATVAVTSGQAGAKVERSAEAAAQMTPNERHPRITRSNHFVYRLVRPQHPDGITLVLLHGAGGNETSLMTLAAASAPNAMLLGVRGRFVQGGRNRWYRRLSPIRFDQADIRAEADAFAAFLTARARERVITPDNTVFIGYSNGANLIAATALLHPGLVRRAVLLRPMPVLDDPPAASLSGAAFLLVTGRSDRTYGPLAPALGDLMRGRGASVLAEAVDAGHMLGAMDIEAVSRWLAAGFRPALARQ